MGCIAQSCKESCSELDRLQVYSPDLKETLSVSYIVFVLIPLFVHIVTLTFNEPVKDVDCRLLLI